MKAFILLAATGLGTLVALPHLPDMTTIKNEVDAAFATVSTQLSQLPQPAQPGQTAQSVPDSTVQDGAAADSPSSPETPFVAQASPDDLRRTYGEPQHVERSIYGETWYYPVYIIYLRNGYMHRVHRWTSSTRTAATTSFPVMPSRSSLATSTVTTAPQAASQSWRFSNHSALGTVTLGGYGAQRTSTYVPRQAASVPTTGVANTTSTTYSNHHFGGSLSSGGTSSSSTCSRPAASTTVAAPHPVVVQHSAPVTTGSYSRVGY